MSSSIQVAIKVRPLIRREEEENLPIQWTVQDKCIAPLDPELKKRGEGGFYFDHIFGIETTNIDVFNTIAKPIVEAAVNGFNGTIFAYGQTSSGKTYTMMGSRDVPGVIPLSIDYIFGLIQKSDRQFLLRVSYTEIYNERVNDLLNPEGIDLKIKEDVKGQAFVKCKEELVNSPEQVLVIVKKGDKNRRIGETNMNERSSRSHTILRITIESREANDEACAIQVSQLNLVDLAGSERAAQTGASGTRFKEGTHINMSLSALGLVIMQLSEAQENSKNFVNFRDSKLTRILQPSLGGNAMTTIICAVTPAALEETQCTLAFASRAKRIKNKPKLNEELSDAALLKRYAKQLSKLETELKKVQSADVVEMASKLLEKERANQILEERIELLKKSILCGNSGADKEDAFKTEAKRRRTWGGGGAPVTKNPIFQNAIGLPTIVESDRTPEKKKEQFKQHSKRRQSIIQQIDIANETFQTAFADFELELIEREKARNDGRLSDVSNASDDDNFITRRPQRTVKFMDDVSVFSSTDRSSDATEPKSPEQCNAEPELPETPKVALRRRISFLMEQYNSLNVENGNLMEFTKLERQMIVDEEVEKAMAEHNKKLTASEQMFCELNDKYTKLQIHSAETDRLLAGSNDRLSELERQMAESINSLRALRREKQALVDELNKHKGENQTSETLPDNKEEKEISSIFENASYFEDMNVSDIQADSVFSNDTQNAQDLTMYESNVANMTANTTVTSDVREVKLLAEKLNETVQLLTIENAELTNKLANEKECANQNEKHLQDTISELLSKIHAISETVQLLTAENAELTNKLANEKKCANQNEKHLQDTISELLSKIHAITEEKNLLKNSVWELEQCLQKSEADTPTSATEAETVKSIENYKATIASLTAENIELSSNLMNKIEELDRVKDLKSPPADHHCAYRELSVNLSERNKLLENENIELSNNLMEKIEEYDRLKEDLEALSRRSASAPSQENSNNLVEISMNRSNLIEKEQSDRASAEIVDDLLQLSVVESELNHFTNKNGHTTDEPTLEKIERSNGSEIGGPTIDELLQMSIIPNGKSRESVSNDNSSSEDVGAWKIKAEMLIEQVKSLQQLNEKLKDLKRTTCKQCSYLTDLNENRRALKAETKEMNRKLEKLQEKFDRECADTEILRTKANEDLNLTACDSTLNESTMLDSSFSVSVLEDRVQRLRLELDTLKDKYGKLSDDYNEKCDEIEKLQDASSRETTPTPSSIESPRIKRKDNKLNKIETDMESLKMDLRRLKKGLATLGAGVQKFSNEKTTMSNEIESLRAEKLELQKKFAEEDSSIARESIETLEKEVDRLRKEMEIFNAVKVDLENAKASLEAEVQALKTGNSLVEKLTEPEDSTMAEERIKSLENEVSRLSEEVEASNAVKEELRITKSALEAEVQSLKITNESSEVKIADTINSSAEQKRIESLEENLARLTNEIESSNAVRDELQTAKLWLEGEVRSLRTEKESLEAKFADSEETSIPEEKIRRLENDLARLSEEIDISNDSKEELESVKTSLEIEVRSLKAAKESLEEKLGRMEIEVARLNEQIGDSNIAERELENAKSLLDAEVRSLRAAKESLESRFAESEDSSLAEETIEQLRSEVARLNELVAKNRELRNAESPLEAEVEFSTTRKSLIEEGSTELIRSERNAEENNSDLELESERPFGDDEIVDCPNINGYDKTLESLKLKLSESTSDVTKYFENNAEQNGRSAKMSAAMGELNDTESELKDVANSLNKLLGENGSLKKRLMEFEVSEEELTNSKLLLNNEVTSLRAEITKLESSLSVQNQRLRDLEEKNDLLTNELERVKVERAEQSGKEFPEDSPYETLKEYEIMVEELKTKVQEVNNDLRVNASETLELNEQLAKLSAVKEEFNDIRLALESEVTKLKSERAEIEETLTALRRSLEKLEAKNSFLSAELEAMRAEKETIVASKIDSGEPAEKSDSPKHEKSDSHTQEKTIEALNSLVRELTIELDRYAGENAELITKVSELEDKLKNQTQNLTETNSFEKEEKLRAEVNSARECITKEINSMKPTTSERRDLSEKSVSELFGVFVHEIMSKEKEIIKMLTSSFEERKRKLEESARQSVDAEKRANVWAKELEAEIERTQQDLYRQEAKNAELNSEISKLKNLLMESSHENQMLKEKMDVLELDFNTLQADLESRSGGKQNTTLNTTQQERERLIEEALATREMELSSKLRLAEKQYREKLEELTSSLESYKMKTMELTNNLEGFEINDKQLRSIVDMKSSELVKCNNRIESMQSELEHLTERHNRLSRDHDEKSRQVDEITLLLKSKCDKLSEYKTKLETITPEYEHLKDQAAERKVRLEKYKDEIECMTTENEKRVESLRDKLVSEEIKSAGYRKQLADLTNRNTALQMELDELRTKCEELEHANGKLTKSLRNSTSKIRAAEEMENLLDSNRTLQRNLDGAANRIAELQEMRTQTMKELVELRGTYEIVCNENTEMRNTLSAHRSSVNDAIELRGKYEILLQEKNRVALELEDKKSTLVMLERKLESRERENEELKSTNKELDEEMEDMVEKINELTKENAELDDKLYAMSTQTSGGQPKSNEYESKIEELRSHVDRLRGELAAAVKKSECLKNENSELRMKVAHRERVDSLSGESSRSASPALEMEAARVDNRRRRSRTELFNQKRQLEIFEENGKFPWGEGCRCVALEKKVRELEHELVSKNGQVAALEIRIQSENFPYMKKAKDLEELLGSAKRKIKTLEVELLKLRELKNTEISSECKKCKQWEKNKCDKITQCMPETSKIRMNGTSSGVIGEHLQISKLEKTIETLKTLCRTRQRNILELEKKNTELERRVKESETISSTINLHEDMQSEPSTTFMRSTSSRSDSARAMKENLPMVQDVQRPATHLRRNWFN